MSDDRCYGCCQENCESGPYECTCSCHRRNPSPLPSSIIDMPRPCSSCGLFGAHFCPGSKRVDPKEIEGLADAFKLSRALGDDRLCKEHRRYQGLRKPRTQCESCWRHWISLNPR